jgi:hypothetical protein
MGLKKLHCGRRYHTPSTMAPLNQTLQPRVCHDPFPIES